MYACIDLGSNSFHLLIARWRNGRHEIVERFSEKVQLGERIAATSRISPGAFERGVSCLERFHNVLASYPVDYRWAVGTNALRLAHNADEFLAAASRLGFNIDVVSGVEEAALIYAGVIAGMPQDGVSQLVFDIGGGSTELVVGVGHERHQTLSMQIGCIGWRDLWFSEVPQQAGALETLLDDATTAAAETFQQAADSLAGYHWERIFASSGTVKMVDAICRQRHPGLPVSRLAVQDLKHDVLRCALDPDFELAGLRIARRDLLLPGWAVLSGLMQTVSIPSFQFSPTALREGMLHYLVESTVSHASPLSALRAG